MNTKTLKQKKTIAWNRQDYYTLAVSLAFIVLFILSYTSYRKANSLGNQISSFIAKQKEIDYQNTNMNYQNSIVWDAYTKDYTGNFRLYQDLEFCYSKPIIEITQEEGYFVEFQKNCSKLQAMQDSRLR